MCGCEHECVCMERMHAGVLEGGRYWRNTAGPWDLRVRTGEPRTLLSPEAGRDEGRRHRESLAQSLVTHGRSSRETSWPQN